jgi:cobalt ECF transporter T component CbiQ
MNAVFPKTGQARRTAIERSLRGIADALERALSAEEYSRRPGLLQSLDARVKIVSVLALLLAANLSRSLAVIAAIHMLVLVLAGLSAIPPGLLVRRVWLALPFFTGLIIIPALFWTPGPSLWELPFGLAITRTGLTSGLFLLMRVSTSLALTMLLILSTPWNTVLAALSVLRIPDAFVLVLGMTHRYIYLLLRIANDMFLSRQSRVVGHLSTRDQQHQLAAISGALLGKSLSLSGEVYQAMQSRGYRGRIVPLKPHAMRSRDWLWLTMLGGAAVVSLMLGQ